MQEKKALFIQHVEESSFRQACKAVDRDPATIWRWRKADPAFDAAVTAGKKMRNEIDCQLVEDSLVRRLISGDHSASEIIFYLKNRDPERWNDRRIIEHAGARTLEEMIRKVAADHDDDGTAAEIGGTTA